MNETGSVKFSCEHLAVPLSEFAGFGELNRHRRKLYDLGLIGVDADGIGFGNVSIRDSVASQFYITGSGTGKLPDLTIADYARVTDYDFAGNWLRCEGATVASSESLTHAAVYQSAPAARAVIHCHDMNLWEAVRTTVPTTPQQIQYGTPGMAYAVQDLFGSTDVQNIRMFAMSGHPAGLVTFGRDLSEAFDVLLQARSDFGR